MSDINIFICFEFLFLPKRYPEIKFFQITKFNKFLQKVVVFFKMTCQAI